MCQPPPYPPLQRKIDHWQYCQCCYPQLTPMTSLSVRNFMEFMEISSGATGCIFCFVWRVYCDIPAGISNGFSKYACDWHPHAFYNFSFGDSLAIYIWHALHEITVTRVSPNQLTPATELCVTALWAQENKQGEVNYTEILSSNILSNLWLILMAK